MNRGLGIKSAVWSVVAPVVLLLIVFLVLFSSGKMVKRSGTRIGYVESMSSASWKASYVKLNGYMEHSIKIKSGELLVEVTTESGSLELEIVDKDGNQVYKGTIDSDCKFTVGTNGNTKITIRADHHQGSFLFADKE